MAIADHGPGLLNNPSPGAAAYRRLLERLDRWMQEGQRRRPGTVPCCAGCASCCHGPFDITIADVELIRDALGRMDEAERSEVLRRARGLLSRMNELAPEWGPPYNIAALGDERFDEIAGALATEPCPLLGDDGRCRIYDSRPMVCRIIGLPMRSPAGRVIENACPIQDRFPAYAALEPLPFDLEGFELLEVECLRDSARRMLGDAAYWEFETTIAAAIVTVCASLPD